MKNYGNSIKEIRLQHGKTLVEVEQATKISNANLSRWENGLNLPNIHFCVILADYYGITVDELIGHEVKKNW